MFMISMMSNNGCDINTPSSQTPKRYVGTQTVQPVVP